jgi:D-alanyl-D-alanine carboxypeptidase
VAESAVDALVEKPLREGKTPGLQYLVVDPSGVVFARAVGSGDIAGGRAMARATTLMAYSMSKTVTAAAVLQLVEQQEVGLDDAIDRHGVAHPYGDGITIRRLLSHTAGIPNPIPLRWVHRVADHPGFDERAALDSVLGRHHRLASAPGARFRYSNLGYWLLGRLIEEVCHVAFTEYVTGNVLRRLAIDPGELGYAIIEPRTHATGYLEKRSLMFLFKSLLLDRALVGTVTGPWLSISAHYVNGPAFGGLVGCAGGFAKFLQDQLAPRSAVLGVEARDLFFAPQVAGGRTVPMTLGWHVGGTGGSSYFYKEGGGGGFHCMMRLYSIARIGTVLMTNATGFNVARQMDLLDRQFLRIVV